MSKKHQINVGPLHVEVGIERETGHYEFPVSLRPGKPLVLTWRDMQRLRAWFWEQEENWAD